MQGFQIEGKPEQTSEESINPQIGESEQSAHRKVQRRKGNASSIPLFVFIPMEGEPQLFRGAADKATYQKAIEDFLLKKK